MMWNVLDVLLGQGAFGKVVKAFATDIAGMEGRTPVAVKMARGLLVEKFWSMLVIFMITFLLT